LSVAPEIARQQWQQLQDGLAALRRSQLTVAQWSALAQAAQPLQAALPERFGTVLMELLNRLESSALFSEESCSFSQGELLQSLQMWLDKAAAQLDRAEP
jgi:hypothetical protein